MSINESLNRILIYGRKTNDYAVECIACMGFVIQSGKTLDINIAEPIYNKSKEAFQIIVEIREIIDLFKPYFDFGIESIEAKLKEHETEIKIKFINARHLIDEAQTLEATWTKKN